MAKKAQPRIKLVSEKDPIPPFGPPIRNFGKIKEEPPKSVVDHGLGTSDEPFDPNDLDDLFKKTARSEESAPAPETFVPSESIYPTEPVIPDSGSASDVPPHDASKTNTENQEPKAASPADNSKPEIGPWRLYQKEGIADEEQAKTKSGPVPQESISVTPVTPELPNVVETVPETPPATASEPILDQPVTPESSEPKSVKEILVLQEEAFSARREMIAFRHNKKVADLSPEEQEKYKQLRTVSQTKRKAWLAELNKLPEEQQSELKDLTKLKEVQDRLASMTPEQVVDYALEETLEGYKKELAILEAEIKEMDRLIAYFKAYGKDVVYPVSSLGSEEDLKALKARRKALNAKIASMSSSQPEQQSEPAGEANIHTETTPSVESAVPSTPTPEVSPTTPPVTAETVSHTILNYERSRAEIKASRLEFIRESMNALDRKIIEKINEHTNTAKWSGVMDRMRINKEIDDLKTERRRLDREMNERPGFGAKFKEAAGKAYKSVKSRLKFERSKPITLGLNEYPAPSVDDIARVEQEMAGTPAEQVEETGSNWKWLKQRLVGLGTIGWTEFRSAEKMRTGTKEIAKDLGSMSRTIESERDFSQDNAHEEANKIVAKLRAEGIETAGDPRFLEISAEITEQRITRNNAKIDEIVLAEMARLEQQLKGSKGDMGQDILTEENKNKIAIEMRARLMAMRSGQAEFDIKGITTELRTGLDEKWKRRYLYGAVDVALWSVGAYYAGGWLLSSKAKEVVVAKGGAVASKEALSVALKDTIWAEAKRQLIAHGISNPSNGQVLQVATKFCVDSGVKVMANGHLIWAKTVAGKAIDTVLAKGFMIHEAGGLKLIASMVAGA